MTKLEARTLAEALSAAADMADIDGRDTVDLGTVLGQMEDAARTELQAAILAAGAASPDELA
jgi:hypothetical protein